MSDVEGTSSDEDRPGGRMGFALLLVLVLVNLPIAHSSWQQWQLACNGIHATAEVTDTDILREQTDPHHVVRFRLPEEIDPDQQTWPAQVDRATWLAAESDGRIDVRVLAAKPSVHEVDGAESSSLGLVVIVAVDVLVLLLALVLWRRRRSGPATGEPATLEE